MIWVLVWILGVGLCAGIVSQIDPNFDDGGMALSFFWPISLPFLLMIGLGIKIGSLFK